MSEEPEREASGFPAALTISEPRWPGLPSDPQPGDLSRFVAQGFGLGAPPIVTPYGAPEGSYYGFDPSAADPIHAAPRTDGNGGTLYFDGKVREDVFRAATCALGILPIASYAVFSASSRNPVEERFLDQLRFVSVAALHALYRVADDVVMPEQAVDATTAGWAFIEAQRAKWNDGHAYSQKLSGTAGADGDWAKETLGFGLHVENSYWRVFRIWSRPWLMTK